MEKPSSTCDSGGAAPYNTVFIDTSLGTHLAMTVSNYDTVSDLKKKILYEHPLCFPNVGGINIHALKVKRKGNFYHLSDLMLVKSAFDGIRKSWFLSVDASRPQENLENQNSGKPESRGLVACFGITNNLSSDGIGLLSDGPAKKLSNVDDSLLPLVQRDWHAKEKPSSDFNPDINCNVLSLDTSSRSNPELQKKHELDSNECKDPIMNTGCDDDNFGNATSDAQFSVSLDGVPTTESAMKNKRKTRKRREAKSLDHALKENDASAQEPDKDNSLVIEDGVFTYDIVMGNENIADKPSRISSSDTNKRPGGEVPMTNELSNGTAVPGQHVECEKDKSIYSVVNEQCHVSMEKASPGPTKKREKTLNRQNYSEENRVLCDSTNDTTGLRITISQCSLVDKQKSMNVTVDHPSSEILKDGHLLTSSPSTGKRKRKRKSSEVANQEVASVHNSAGNDGVENTGYAVGGWYKDLERELVAPVVPGQVVQGSIIFEPCSVSVMEELSFPVQGVGENNVVSVPVQEVRADNKVSGSVDVDTSAADARYAEITNDPSEAAAASAVKGMRILDDHHTTESEANPSVAAQEDNDLNDSRVAVELGKSSKKRKKSKQSQDPVTVTQVTAGTEEHCTIEAEGNPPVFVQEGNHLSKYTGLTEHGDAVVNDCQKFGSDQMVGVEEERELLRSNDTKEMPSEKCFPFSRDEIGMNSKAGVTFDLLDTNDNSIPGKSSKKRKKSKKSIPFSREEIDANSKVEETSNKLDTIDVAEPGKSSKRKKKSKRTQDLVTVLQVTSGTEEKTGSVIGMSSTEQHETVHDDHFSDKSRKEGIQIPGKENEESKAKTVNASILATDRETSNKLDTIDVGEPGKSSKRKKKSKRTQDLVTVPQVTSGTEEKTGSVIDMSLTEQHETVHDDHLSDKSGKEEGIQIPGKENEESKAKTVNAIMATDRETDNVIRNVLESLQDLNKNAENKVEKSRKKTKGKRSSGAKSVPEWPTEDENVSYKNVKLAADRTRELEVDASSILTKTNLEKTSIEHQLKGSNWKPENISVVDFDPLRSQLNVKSSQELSYKPDGNKESPLQGNNGNFPKSGCTDKAIMEVSCEIDRTIVNDNFVPSQNQPEAVVSSMSLVDKMTETAKGPDNDVKTGKEQKKLDVHSSHPSPDLQSSIKLSESKGSGEKAQGLHSSTVKPQSSVSAGNDDNLKHNSKRKLLEVPGTGRKAPPPSQKSDKFNPKTKEATRPDSVHASGMKVQPNKKKKPIAASNSSLESFKSIIPQSERVNRHQSQVAVRKSFSNNNNGEVLNSSERKKKSLLAASGTIFKDESKWSSDDDGGVDNSDTSTRTPSDNSLSSDYSDGDSSTPQNGSSYSHKRKEQRRRNISRSHSSLNLDTILRSSSRYKAAKLTASQSQPLDFESQPDEFVPDSRGNL